jgi:hypothetical protein
MACGLDWLSNGGEVLAVSGVPDVALAAWTGHANANFTKRVYVHPSPEDLRVASDHLTSLLGFSEGEAA